MLTRDLQDGVVLARALQQLLRPSHGTSNSGSNVNSGSSGSSGSNGSSGRRGGLSGSGVPAAELEAALRQFEADRRKRILPLTLRSHAFGRLLQIPFPPVSFLYILHHISMP